MAALTAELDRAKDDKAVRVIVLVGGRQGVLRRP